MAVGVDVALLGAVVGRVAPPSTSAIARLVARQVVGVGDRVVGRRLELLARVAGDLAERLVDAQEAPVERPHRHPDRRLVERRAEAVLGLAQRVLGAAALGDVLDLRDEVERLAGVVAHERDRQQHPALLAVRAHVALLHPVAAPLARDHLAHELEVGLEVVGVGDVLEGQRRAARSAS